MNSNELSSKLAPIFKKMANSSTYRGRKPRSLHDRGLDGNTPLHVAVLSNDLDAGKNLLEFGANPNAPGDQSNTPLHLAVSQKNYNFVQLLMSHAASTELKNKAELSAADLVQQLNDNRLSEIFSSAPKKQLPPEVEEILKKMEDDALDLLGIKIDNVNARGILGDTPLHVATVWGLDTARILLKAGANPNLPGEYDHTPLHQAVMGKNYEMAKLLLEYGASPDLVNEDGFTPAEYAEDSDDPRLRELFHVKGKTA